jgi:hypothetical protein
MDGCDASHAGSRCDAGGKISCRMVFLRRLMFMTRLRYCYRAVCIAERLAMPVYNLLYPSFPFYLVMIICVMAHVLCASSISLALPLSSLLGEVTCGSARPVLCVVAVADTWIQLYLHGTCPRRSRWSRLHRLALGNRSKTGWFERSQRLLGTGGDVVLMWETQTLHSFHVVLSVRCRTPCVSIGMFLVMHCLIPTSTACSKLTSPSGQAWELTE